MWESSSQGVFGQYRGGVGDWGARCWGVGPWWAGQLGLLPPLYADALKTSVATVLRFGLRRKPKLKLSTELLKCRN